MATIPTGTADVLSSAVNAAVVQLPGRRYPGVVIQGDSLAALHGEIVEAETALPEGSDARLAATMARERLEELLDEYERTLAAAGIDLPYHRPRRG